MSSCGPVDQGGVSHRRGGRRQEADAGAAGAGAVGAQDRVPQSGGSRARVKHRGVRVFAVPTVLLVACLAGLGRPLLRYASADPASGASDGPWSWRTLAWGVACLLVVVAGRPLRWKVVLHPCLALVTGGTEGIGLQLAKCLVRDGHSVILVARSKPRLDEVADQLRSLGPTGVDVHVVCKDLSTPNAGAELYQHIRQRGWDVDLLVNNAGFGTGRCLWDASPEFLAGMVNTNVASVTALTRRFVADMRARGGGKILNLASTSSFQPVPYFGAYGATKAYIHSLTLSLAFELRDEGSPVTATSLAPGATVTRFGARAGITSSRVFAYGLSCTAEFVAKRGYDAWMNGELYCVPGLLDHTIAVLVGAFPYHVTCRAAGVLLLPA